MTQTAVSVMENKGGMMASSMDQTIDLRYYIRVLWRRKGIIVLCAISTICATAVAVTLMPDVYESSVTVLVEERRMLSAELEHLIGSASRRPSGYRAEEKQLAQLSARILSVPFLERVIRRLQMEQDPVIRAEAAELMQGRSDVSVDEMVIRMLAARLEQSIRISSRNGTYSIVVSEYTAQNAYLLAHQLGQVLVDTRRQSNLDLMKSARDFGMQHLRFYEQQVRAAEDSLERFKSSLIEQGFELSLVHPDNLVLANVLEQRIQGDLLEAQSRVARLGIGDDATGVTTHAKSLWDDPEVRSLHDRIRTVLKGAITDHLGVASATESVVWPPQGMYATLRRELLQYLQASAAQLASNANDEPDNAIATYAFYQMDVEAKSDVAAYLNQSIRQCKQRQQSKPVEEMELGRLENNVASYRQLLESFKAQKVASDLDQSVALTSLGERVEIISPAQFPLEPSHPNKTKLLLAALLMGPCIGVAAAFLSLVLDTTSRSLDEFRRVVPEPILGTTPLLSKMAPRHRGIRRYWVPAAVTGVILATATFFVLKSNLRQDLASIGRPAQIVNPEVISP